MTAFAFLSLFSCGPEYDCSKPDVVCSGEELEGSDTAASSSEDASSEESGSVADPPTALGEGCHERIVDWPEEWIRFEERVLEEVNIRRAQPADCGTEGLFEPTTPLVMDPEIQCAARYHSLWMSENSYSHESPGGDLGDDPQERLSSVGYQGAWGENIYASPDSPEAAVQGWMESDGHCSNIMSDWWTVIGVGYYFNEAAPSQHYWTQNFGDR